MIALLSLTPFILGGLILWISRAFGNDVVLIVMGLLAMVAVISAIRAGKRTKTGLPRESEDEIK